ncbi:unnamed protein product [Victoria cruziana]
MRGYLTTLLYFLLLAFFRSCSSQSLVPAIITFGDSAVDVGNNNYLFTIFKADFPPYGRDFVNHKATGRFCNGKLATDFTAENLGFTSYPLAYLDPQATGKKLFLGANFASAGSGYYDATALQSKAIPLSQQVEYYKEYQSKLADVAGQENATSILSQAVYILSAGSSDFVQNYYINPLLNKLYTPDAYSEFLVEIFCNFVQNLYDLGARRIGVTSVPPLGCLPATITLFGFGSNDCVTRINNDAQSFNKKLNSAAKSLQKQLSDLKLVVFDIYTPFYDLIQNPVKNGFFETRKGCCGTGVVETAILCNPKSIGTCSNATEYVFWDAVHPSQAANQKLADALLLQGISLIG